MINPVKKTAQLNSPSLSVSYKSPGLLSDLLLSLPDAVITTDANFNITGLNPSAEAVYGLPLTDALGKSLFEMINIEIIDGNLAESISELLTKGSWEGKVLYIRFDGTQLFFNSKATVIKDETGQLSAIVFINQNITEKKEQEKKLAIAKDEYKTVVESLSEGVVMIKANGTISTSNKTGAEILGLTEEEICGIRVASPKWKSVREDESEFPLHEFPAILSLTTGKACNDVIMGIEKEKGKRVWISINTRPIFTEGIDLPTAVVATFKDITEQRKMLGMLKESETLFRTFFHNSPTGCFIYDEDGYVVMGNNEFNKSSNSPENTVGKHIREIFPEKFAERIIKRNNLFLESGKSVFLNEEMQGPDGNTVHYLLNLNLITIPGKKRMIACQAIDITEEKNAVEKLKGSEDLFRSFMKNTSALGWIYDENGKLIYGNDVFMEKVGLTEESIGKNVFEIEGSPEIRKMVLDRINQVMETGETVIIEDAYPDNKGQMTSYLSHWFLLSQLNGTKLIGGQSIIITDRKNAEQQIEKLNEQYTYALKASSDAIWDLDLETNEIYRSGSFTTISGYTKEQIAPTIDWWYEKIHPEDRERIKNNTSKFKETGVENWQDEYRFRYADGTYGYLIDKGFTIFRDNKAVRMIGAIQDISERKKLEAQLLHEQVQKQKMINQATITAQEKERGMLSAELHDNVNQLLMSAKLHIGVAKNAGKNQNDLLDKASEYLLMAVDELRALSKRLNNKIVKTVGLEKSIKEIGNNMYQFNNIELTTEIEDHIIDKLSQEQQLMVFRIIQEQSNNITKYSEATMTSITIKENNNTCFLSISDNGKGFDKKEQKVSGIGLINIFNRADAYNGKAEIISAPGNGCTINVQFPITNSCD